MSIEGEIGVDERRRRLSKVRKCYDKANRRQRSRLLDEMEAVTGLLPESSIRLLTGSLKRKPRHSQRGCTYGPDVDDALHVIAEGMDYICAEGLAPSLSWLPMAS